MVLVMLPLRSAYWGFMHGACDASFAKCLLGLLVRNAITRNLLFTCTGLYIGLPEISESRVLIEAYTSKL